MTISRYGDREVVLNNHPTHSNILDNRGLKSVVQYATPEFEYPETADLASIERIRHIWKFGDRYYKLADQYYGDSKLWWIIAFYNKKPTDAHVSLGDVIRVPVPLEEAIRFMEF